MRRKKLKGLKKTNGLQLEASSLTLSVRLLVFSSCVYVRVCHDNEKEPLVNVVVLLFCSLIDLCAPLFIFFWLFFFNRLTAMDPHRCRVLI